MSRACIRAASAGEKPEVLSQRGESACRRMRLFGWTVVHTARSQCPWRVGMLLRAFSFACMQRRQRTGPNHTKSPTCSHPRLPSNINLCKLHAKRLQLEPRRICWHTPCHDSRVSCHDHFRLLMLDMRRLGKSTHQHGLQCARSIDCHHQFCGCMRTRLIILLPPRMYSCCHANRL